MSASAPPRDRPLRVLVVAHGYPPHEHAGAELCAHWLARALAARGHAVTVFARGGHADLPELALTREAFEGLPVTRVRTRPERATSLRATYLDPRVTAVFARELAAAAAAGRPYDVVHFHHTIGLSIDLIEAAKQSGARVIATLHDFWFLCPRGQRMTPGGHLCREIEPERCSRCIAKKRVKWALNAALAAPLSFLAELPGYVAENLHTRAIRRRTREIVAQLNRCDRLLAPSLFVLDEHIRHGIDPSLVRHFENGIDPRFAAMLPARPAPAALAAPVRFGYVGSFLPSKGVDLLVTAFQEIRRGTATLDLHGTSPWDGGRFARAVAAANGHPGARFNGSFDHDRLAEILANLDVLVVPSRWFENAPVTLDEAALARIPVIVADQGGMQETLARRRNGVAFRPDDALDLARQMQRFIDEPGLWAALRDPATPVRTADEAASEFERLVRAL